MDEKPAVRRNNIGGRLTPTAKLPEKRLSAQVDCRKCGKGDRWHPWILPRFSERIPKEANFCIARRSGKVPEASGMAGFRLPIKPNCQVPGLARANETSRRVPVPR